MSYSDRESSNVGLFGGIGGAIIFVLIIGLKVGLKSMARSARHNNYSNSQYDNTSSNLDLPETNREASRITKIGGRPSSGLQHESEFEKMRAETERRNAEDNAAVAERQRQEAERLEAERQRVETERQQREQAAADNQARLLAEVNAREAELRNQAAQNEAPPVVPPTPEQPLPAAEPPPEAAPMPAAAPVAEAEPAAAAPFDETPGFAIAELSQVKPRDSVLVHSDGQWQPALVQAKRAQLVQVRLKDNGKVETVTLDKLRLEKEPVAKVDSGLPAALRAVGATTKPKANPADEDDSIFVAKPNKDGADVSPAAAPSTPAAIKPVRPGAPKAEPAAFRTWTNDTGEFKVDALLVGFEFDLVQLKRRDGKVISLPIQKLSLPDQAAVRQAYK